MQISVIIPAYNAAKYLNRCIESVANQDLPYDCYEAIVINDGSTDESIEILDALCEKYSFLRYITVKNQGVGCARNRGVIDAKGDYLLFLDADDSIIPNCLKVIYEEMSGYSLDLLLLNYQHIAVDGTLLLQPYHMEENDRKVMKGRDFLFKDCYPAMIPLYVYRRKFLLDNNLKIMSIRHEDEEFVPRALFFAQRIKYLPFCFYNYYQNIDSFMSQYQEADSLNMIKAMVSLNEFKFTCQDDALSIAYFDNHIAVILIRLFKHSIRKGYQNQREMFMMAQEGGLFPLKPKRSSFYCRLINLSPVLFEKYYRFIKRKPKLKKQ